MTHILQFLQHTGVCRDSEFSGSKDDDNVQLVSCEITPTTAAVTFTRPLAANDAQDLPWSAAEPANAVWAVGATSSAASVAAPGIKYHEAVSGNCMSEYMSQGSECLDHGGMTGGTSRTMQRTT